MTAIKVTIRLANSSDNHLLAEMGRQTFYDSFASDNSPQDMAIYLESAFSPQKQAQELADPRTTFLIAIIDGTWRKSGLVEVLAQR